MDVKKVIKQAYESGEYILINHKEEMDEIYLKCIEHNLVPVTNQLDFLITNQHVFLLK